MWKVLDRNSDREYWMGSALLATYDTREEAEEFLDQWLWDGGYDGSVADALDDGVCQLEEEPEVPMGE